MLSLYQTLTEKNSNDTGDGPHDEAQENEQQQCSDDELSANTSQGFKTWRQAHTAYCVEKCVVRASVQQIIQEYYPDDYELPWELPPLDQVVTSSVQLPSPPPVTAPPEESTTDIKSSVTSSVLNFGKKWGTKLILSAMNYDDEDYVVDEEALMQGANETATIASEASLSPRGLLEDLSIPVIHVDRTLALLQELQTRLFREITSDRPIGPGQSDKLWIIPRADWNEWFRNGSAPQEKEETESTVSLFKKLPSSDIDWLLQVLVDQGRATFVSRESQQDLIVVFGMSSSSRKTSSAEKEDISSTGNQAVDVAVALWDLQAAQTKVAALIRKWSDEMESCRTKALEYKRNGSADGTKQVLLQMRKRKILQQQIDSSSATLLTIEQTSAAIEMAQTNQAVFELLGESKTLLSTLSSEGPSVEEVEELHEQLADEVHQVSTVTEAIGRTGGDTYNDDDLLQELVNLTLESEKHTNKDESPDMSLPSVPASRLLETRPVAEIAANSCRTESTPAS